MDHPPPPPPYPPPPPPPTKSTERVNSEGLQVTRNAADEIERDIHQAYTSNTVVSNMIAENLKLLGALEMAYKSFQVALQDNEKLEQEFVQQLVNKDSLVVESVEQVNFVHQLRTRYGWMGDVVVIKPLFGIGQAAQATCNAVLNRCIELGIIAKVYEQYT